MKKYLLSLAGATALTAVLFGVLHLPKESPAPISSSTNTPTLAYSIPMRQVGGTALELPQLKGSPSLVYVFKATCPHCKEFYPKLAQLAHKFAERGLKTVLICSGGSTPIEIAAFQKSTGAQLPILQDTSRAFQQNYSITTIPTVFLAQADGTLERFEHDRLDRLDSALQVLTLPKDSH